MTSRTAPLRKREVEALFDAVALADRAAAAGDGAGEIRHLRAGAADALARLLDVDRTTPWRALVQAAAEQAGWAPQRVDVLSLAADEQQAAGDPATRTAALAALDALVRELAEQRHIAPGT